LPVQARDAGFQLRQRAGARQLHVVDVVDDVHVRHVDPHRVGEAQRHLGQLARKGRRQMQPRSHVSAHVFDKAARVTRGRLEQTEAADVHRHLGRFQMQEQRVQPA
jgi:hypothetical protein